MKPLRVALVEQFFLLFFLTTDVYADGCFILCGKTADLGDLLRLEMMDSVCLIRQNQSPSHYFCSMPFFSFHHVGKGWRNKFRPLNKVSWPIFVLLTVSCHTPTNEFQVRGGVPSWFTLESAFTSQTSKGLRFASLRGCKKFRYKHRVSTTIKSKLLCFSKAMAIYEVCAFH